MQKVPTLARSPVSPCKNKDTKPHVIRRPCMVPRRPVASTAVVPRASWHSQPTLVGPQGAADVQRESTDP